jgi:hypothetical protein
MVVKPLKALVPSRASLRRTQSVVDWMREHHAALQHLFICVNIPTGELDITIPDAGLLKPIERKTGTIGQKELMEPFQCDR